MGTTIACYGIKRLVDTVCYHHVLFGDSNHVFLIVAVRHLNTIAYPEKFFETAQAIAAQSHLCWPDLTQEWIRSQEARIARGEFVDISPRIFINNLSAPAFRFFFIAVDWESRLPVVSGPVSRACPFLLRNSKCF